MKIEVKVHPRSSRSKVEERGEGKYEVWVCSPPERGKANREVIELLADYFGVKKGDIRIVSGEKAKKKIIEVRE